MSHTHELRLGPTTVSKTYTDYSRGEDVREWQALQLITRHARGLVPVPLRSAPGLLTMSRIPGQPLAGRLRASQLDALEGALRRLWAVPAADLRPIGLAGFVRRVRAGLDAWTDATGRYAEARAAAYDWLTDVTLLSTTAEPQVIGHGDPNLANYLWDGHLVRIVDFEDAGRSEIALELANLVEHITSRRTDWGGFAERFDVDAGRFRRARCLWAIFWLTLLRPGGVAEHRNPPGTGQQQASRVLQLLG